MIKQAQCPVSSSRNGRMANAALLSKSWQCTNDSSLPNWRLHLYHYV